MTEPATKESAATAAVVPIAPVLFKSRAKGKGKANMRKRSPSPPPARDDSDSDSDGDSDGSSDGGRPTVHDKKRRRRARAGVISASTEGAGVTRGNGTLSATTGLAQPEFVADRTALLADSETATRRSHMFDEDGDKKQSKSGKAGPGGPAAAPKPTPGASMAGMAPRSVGPVKAPSSNVRTITITDFSPDVCKDYKQTGFCGFGDNCKFLHAREDYKQGWQLDNEWEAVTKGKKNLGGTVVASAANRYKGGGRDAAAAADDDDDEAEEEMLRNIPFACIICRQSYKQPVVTRCGHYFCERCALDRYRRDPTCAACGAATTGVFNSAKRLSKLLERKRERAAKRRQAAMEAGEEVSSDEEAEESE